MVLSLPLKLAVVLGFYTDTDFVKYNYYVTLLWGYILRLVFAILSDSIHEFVEKVDWLLRDKH